MPLPDQLTASQKTENSGVGGLLRPLEASYEQHHRRPLAPTLPLVRGHTAILELRGARVMYQPTGGGISHTLPQPGPCGLYDTGITNTI